MKKAYYLSTCSTCQRILRDVMKDGEFELQDIKTEPIAAAQLDEMKKLVGSFEALFSRRAQKYRQMGLHEKSLTEDDYRDLILKEYTFLKRPVVYLGDQIFVGNTKNTVAALNAALA